MRVYTKKTYEEHLEYLYSIVRLKLWFIWWWKQNNPNESFHSILRERVDIYRKTNINHGTMNPDKTDFNDSEWLDLEKQLDQLYQKYSFKGASLKFEDAAFELVQGTVDARSKRDYEERPYVLDYQCGSLLYDPPKDDHPKRVPFHIANAVAPESIFADKKYLPECLTDLMNKSADEYDADSLSTHTWLNSHPKWSELFPASWHTNMSPENKNIQWHFGFWGQFITAKGTFNYKLGQQLRDTGKFPFLPHYSWCTFKSLRKHLLEKFQIDI
ncbi:MAG: hypothetical protein GY756_04255 [bacterium]|nr:hypothetical protein [bacterium]